MNKRPKCKIVGEDGNIFNLVALAEKALVKAGQKHESDVMREKVFRSDSYQEALAVICEYVDAY